MIDYKKRKIKAKSIQKSLLKRPTVSELEFKDILNEMGIKYQFQKKIFTQNNFYIADFYLIKHKIIFEIDGGVHIDKFEYDQDREIEILRFKKAKLIVRFSNEYVKSNKEDVKKEITDILNKQGKIYQGLISRKSRLLGEIGREKDKKRKQRKFLRDQLNQRPHLKSQLTKQEYEVISMLLGLDNNIPHSVEEINKKIGFEKNKIIQIIGKLFWLIKTD